MLGMKSLKNANMKELHWKDVRVEFAKKNAELAKVIDEIDPGSEYTLFKVNYPFGSEILKNSRLFVPNNKGALVPLNSTDIPKNIQDKLSYNINSNPVSIILNHTAELFIVLENHTIPLYGLISPGKVFGTWRILNPNRSHNPVFIWDMTAGARSTFMLPKISETAGYAKLRREFQLNIDNPKQLLDHWGIFKEIANHPDFGDDWSLEILFFSKKWFERLNDKKWIHFKMHLLEKAWEGSEFFRNQFMWNLAFSLIQKDRKIKPDPYDTDTVKQLLAMGIGALPGFAPALNDEAAPIRKLQDVFSNIYQLHNYSPTIMQPHFFSLENSRPVYYSLQYPITIEFSPKKRENSTKIFSLYRVNSILNKYLTDIHSNKFNLSDTPIYNLLEQVQYDFFHTEIKNYTGIRSSKEIPQEDPSFIQSIGGKSKKFPSNSAFIRGCIRVTAKPKKPK
jgi:hypothetical protein